METFVPLNYFTVCAGCFFFFFFLSTGETFATAHTGVLHYSQCLAKKRHSLDSYFERSNRNSGVLLRAARLRVERRGLEMQIGVGGGRAYCADDSSPVQTSSSSAPQSPQYTLSYYSYTSDLLLKHTAQNTGEFGRLIFVFFSLCSVLGAMSDIKFLLRQKQTNKMLGQ